MPDFTCNTNMAFPATIDANATCSLFLEYAQEQKHLCEWLFVFGIFLPVIIWPLLPSKSEAINYHILAASSLALLISTFLWYISRAQTETDDSLLSFLFQQAWPTIIAPLLAVWFTFGRLGRDIDGSPKRLVWRNFQFPATLTSILLLHGTPHVGKYLFSGSSERLWDIEGYGIYTIAMICGTKPLMTIYYCFISRRISSLYWLPQNGSETDFNPWWSQVLRFVWIGCSLFVVSVPPATLYLARKCQLQLELPRSFDV